MKSLRILILVHEDLIPPADKKGFPDVEIVQWKTEYDVVTTLKQLEHDVQILDPKQSLVLACRRSG